MKEEVQTQGVFDLVNLLDRETTDKIKSIIVAIDPDKIKRVMDTIEVDDDGIQIKINLRVRK
jgi:hypothetical protein